MKIGLMSPGSMGASVAKHFVQSGFKVYSSLTNRSKTSRKRAVDAGIIDLDSLEDVVSVVEVFFSILPPDNSKFLASEVAQIALNNKLKLSYFDMNAISPKTSFEINNIFKKGNVTYVDGGIIGGPPKNGIFPKFYLSGNGANVLNSLNGIGIEIRILSDQIGDASALKMCYASITKGTLALYATSLIVSKKHGVFDHFMNELSESQDEVFKKMISGLPKVKSKAYRWIGEMLEISKTYEEQSASGDFHKAAAATYQLIANEFARNSENITQSNEKLINGLSELINNWTIESDNQ